MKQKIPTITDNDIKRIIQRDFPNKDSSEIENILKLYQSEEKKGRNRVHASILKLANGNFESIKMYVDKANYDYRDIIALSEYPNYSKCSFDNNITEKQKKILINTDWEQYQTWLQKDFL